jgi:hypothetical protein
MNALLVLFLLSLFSFQKKWIESSSPVFFAAPDAPKP